MPLRDALACVAEMPWPETFEDFRQRIDPAWIQEALEATGTATLRRRRLPARLGRGPSPRALRSHR